MAGDYCNPDPNNEVYTLWLVGAIFDLSSGFRIEKVFEGIYQSQSQYVILMQFNKEQQNLLHKIHDQTTNLRTSKRQVKDNKGI